MTLIALYLPPIQFLSGRSMYLFSILRWKMLVLYYDNSSISFLFWNILYIFSGILLFKNRNFGNVFRNQRVGITKYTTS